MKAVPEANRLATGRFSVIPGIRISPTKKLTTGRMTRILRAMGLSVGAHAEWTGWTLRRFITANPEWTERLWLDLIMENYEAIAAFGLKEEPVAVPCASVA
jgi:hypothetical protein